MQLSKKLEIPKTKVQGYDFLTLRVGSEVTIGGITCTLKNINRGKRRLTFSAPSLPDIPMGKALDISGVKCFRAWEDPSFTFTPTDPAQRMPIKQMSDPVIKVTSKRRT